VSAPKFDTAYVRKVSDTSGSGNPIIADPKWDKKVVVITDDRSKFSKGVTIKFVVKREIGDHYQALLNHQAPVTKPKYYSKPNIPIHHDGKDNQSVTDTRSETHAFKPINKRR
jgi:hypothetical protein